MSTLKEIAKVGWRFTPEHAIANVLAQSAPFHAGVADPNQTDRVVWIHIEAPVGRFVGAGSCWDSCFASETSRGPRVSLGNRHGLANFLANWMRDR